jgi:hypothetical protein
MYMATTYKATNGRTFRENADDSLVCAHRDLSVCDECEAQTTELTECYGNYYWDPNGELMMALQSDLTEDD